MIYRFRILTINYVKSSSIARHLLPVKTDFFCLSSKYSTNEFTNNSSSNVSISSIKQNLEKHNIQYAEGFTNLIVECTSCKKRSLCINKISGFSICYSCKKSGSWLDNNVKGDKLDDFLTLETNECIKLGSTSWKSLSHSLSEPVHSFSQTQQSILKRTLFDHFPLSLLKKIKVKFDEKSSEICVALTDTSNEVGYKRISSDSEVTFPFKGACGVVINGNGNDSAIVVPSLRDLLCLSLHNLSYDIISLPYGQQKLPQEVLPILEKYKKLVLWFDNDSASWDNVRIFARKLFEQRCFLVSPDGSKASAHKAFKDGYHLGKIIASAQPVAHPSIITFSSLRQDVMFDLQNIEKVSGVKWKRFPTLNKILKGHRRGELTILTGPTGCGKTTFISEFSLDLAIQGVTTLWGSFEIKNQRLARTMLQQFTMVPLENNIHRFHRWADKFEQLPLYFMTFHGQQSLDLVMAVVEHATYVHDIAHVIIDNVQFMLGLTSTESGFLDRFYRQDALIGAFRNFATKANCHVTLVIHPRKEREGEMLNANSIFGGAKASQEADNILIMQTKTLNSLKIKKYLQISKNRYSGDLGVMPLEFDPHTLSFANDSEPPR